MKATSRRFEICGRFQFTIALGDRYRVAVRAGALTTHEKALRKGEEFYARFCKKCLDEHVGAAFMRSEPCGLDKSSPYKGQRNTVAANWLNPGLSQ